MGQAASRNDFLGAQELKVRIQHLRKDALKKIEDLSQQHGQNVAIINEKEVDLFLHQIKNKMILVAIVGEGSAGKSTLTNAFLRDRFLPSGIGRVTGVRIFIGHDPNVHSGPCKSPGGSCNSCPFLVKGFGEKKKLCQGVKNIESAIKQENTMHDDHKDQKAEPLVLYTYIPVFASIDSPNSPTHFTPYLVDSPGVEVINADVHSYYSIQSAMVYVENYQRLLQNVENIKKELDWKAKDASLLFVVSHFDDYYTSFDDTEANPDKEKTKRIITDAITEVACDDVFPVCGKWALNAHLALKYHEKDKNASHIVDLACTEYRFTRQEKLDISDKASFLLSITAFEELEERLRQSISATDFHQWNINMYNQCRELLKGPIKAGNSILQKIESEEKYKKDEIERLNGKEETLKSLEEDVQRYYSEELEQSFQKFSTEFFETRLVPKIKTTLNRFYSSCEDSVVKSYKFGRFTLDMKEFKENELSEVVVEEVNDEVAKCIKALKCKLEQRYKELIGHISDKNSSSITLSAVAGNERLNCYSFGEPSEKIRNFVNGRTFGAKLRNLATGVVTGVGGFGVPGGLVAYGACVTSAPFIAAMSVPVLGVVVGAYFVHRTISITDDEMELSKEDVGKLYNEMASDIKAESSSIKEKFDKIVQNALQEYYEALEDEYQRLWKWKLGQELIKEQKSLEVLCHQKDELQKALTELEDCDSFLEKLLEEETKEFVDDTHDYDIIDVLF